MRGIEEGRQILRRIKVAERLGEGLPPDLGQGGGVVGGRAADADVCYGTDARSSLFGLD